MSEKIRKAAGTALMVLTAAMIAAGCFPVRRPEPKEYSGQGKADPVVPAVSELAKDSPVNAWDAAALESLPGIGPVTAEKIVNEREGNGPFIYPEDLISVPGIGETKMALLREILINESGESEE